MGENRSIDDVREEKRAELAANAADERDDGAAGTPSDPVHVGSPEELTETTAEYDVVLVDFHAEWCGPCRMLEPVVARVAADTDAVVAKVDVDENQGLAGEYGVRGVPTLVLFADGEPVQRLVGMQDENTLVDLVENHS